jgi:hypothetical protein
MENKKSVLFLDNDGVICLSNNWGSRLKKRKNVGIDITTSINETPLEYRFDDFDWKAIKILNEILEETGADIVVSSDWRLYANLDELGEYYTSQGIIKKPIAVTGLLKDILPEEYPSSLYSVSRELERYMEIEYWVENHPEITKWVAVDDLNMSVDYLSDRFKSKDKPFKKPGLKNFVYTPFGSQGIKQTGIKEKILKFLI